MKSKRQRKIIELITNNNIETQEELAGLLMKSGFEVTQATISRDIRELNLTKVQAQGGGQKYVVPADKEMASNSKYKRVLVDGILSIDTAENIVVLKTVAGMAMAVGAAVDAMNIKEIMGCVAGDDTVLCVVKTAAVSEQVKEYLDDFIV